MAYNRNQNRFTYKIYAYLFGYDEKKYWKRRTVLVDKNIKKGFFKKIWYLIYCKRAEARNAASLGTAVNAGATFLSKPILPHGLAGIFISHKAKIGRDCTILQNVTIGSSKDKAPSIGDNCVIGAGAVIIGDVKIGNNCCIGANCTVVKDVPDNTTVVGAAPRYITKEQTERNFRF